MNSFNISNGRLMSGPTSIRTLVQISEDAQRPVHVPILLGNDYYLVTQQDVRKVQDERLISYCKITANGQLLPMEMLGQDNSVLDALLSVFQMQQQLQAQCASNVAEMQHLSHLFAFPYCGEEHRQQDIEMAQEPSTRIAATMEQQLQWGRVPKNSSAPFPPSYSTATSTTELTAIQAKDNYNRDNRRTYCTRACNTVEGSNTDQQRRKEVKFECDSARQQLKERKMKTQPLT